MTFRLIFGVALGLLCTAEMAQARSKLHLYGAVAVAGDPQLTLVYNNALTWCSLYARRPVDTVRAYSGPYGSPAIRSCLARHGFVYQQGEPYAYPVRKVVYVTKW